MSSNDLIYIPAFVCPHCGKLSDVLELEYCPVVNAVTQFELLSYEEETEFAYEVEMDWDEREVWEPDRSKPIWICQSCFDEIDENIKTKEDLFNWLKERNMLEKP